jgi:hypothetical protein
VRDARACDANLAMVLKTQRVKARAECMVDNEGPRMENEGPRASLSIMHAAALDFFHLYIPAIETHESQFPPRVPTGAWLPEGQCVFPTKLRSR